MPRPSEPNSGLTTTSPPRAVNASRAASACWQTMVGGTRRPAASRQALWPGTYRRRFRRPRGGFRTRHAARLQAVQQVHAKDDLFQRSRRHGAHEHGVEVGQRIGADGDAGD